METTNPFKYAKWVSLGLIEEKESLVADLMKDFSLTNLEAKAVWLSCPEYQEKRCRVRLLGSKSRGGDPYGSQMWLRRNFRLSDEELNYVFDDLWESSDDARSERFLEVMTIDRLAQGHLIQPAQDALELLRAKFTTSSS